MASLGVSFTRLLESPLLPRTLNWKSLGHPSEWQIRKFANVRVQRDNFAKRNLNWPESPQIGWQWRAPEPPFNVTAIIMLDTVDNVALIEDPFRDEDFGLRRIWKRPRLWSQ